jgi:hypothetical protein
LKYDYNTPFADVDAHGGIIQQPGAPVESVVSGILGDLHERYGSRAAAPPRTPSTGTAAGPRPGGFGYVSDADFDLTAQDTEPDENGEEE